MENTQAAPLANEPVKTTNAAADAQTAAAEAGTARPKTVPEQFNEELQVLLAKYPNIRIRVGEAPVQIVEIGTTPQGI